MASLLGFACGGGDGGGGPVPAMNTLAKAAAPNGDGQTDTVLVTLPIPYRVIARDPNGAIMQGVTVNWSVTAGGGSVSPLTSMTDAAGVAQVTHTFGRTAGAQSVRATVTGFSGSPVTFTSTATAGVAFQIAASGGSSSSHFINSTFPLSVIARDKYDNPRSGVQVSWAAQTGTGSVAPPQSATGTNGIATTTRTLGPNEGAYTDTAYATGLQGSPVLFTVAAVTAPQTAAVNVGDNFFRSARNNTRNTAVDTVAVGGTVTWTWIGADQHNVLSTGMPSFPSSPLHDVSGDTYQFTFNAAGAYTYTCVNHSTMLGRVVVVP